MREFLRHAALTLLTFALFLALMLGAYVWMARSGAMQNEFSPTGCEKDGGTWDHALELCRRA